jgi:serine protease DegS
MNLKRLLQFASWPIAVGIIIGLLAMLLFPQLRGNPLPVTTSTGTAAPVSYADAVSKAAPAVVNIYTEKKVLQRDPAYYNNPYYRRLYSGSNIPLQERMQKTLGSGVIVDTHGFILTNNHVINDADKIQVLLYDGRETSAELVGMDQDNDLAVLKINLDNLTAITPGQAGNVRVGDVVLAIGNPFGVGQSVSQGIVSATRRWNLGTNNTENFIQTDAAINVGNSGGALVDARGNLIGINTSVLDERGVNPEGISFAVPVDIAMRSLKQILQYGETRQGWLGLAAQPLDERSIGAYGTAGFIITDVEKGSPAEAAGLLKNDIITQVNDISMHNISDVNGVLLAKLHAVQNLVGNISPGSEIKVEVLRNGKLLQLKAIAGAKPRQAART